MQINQPCKRCLLEDMQEEQVLYGMIQERIRLLPDDERTDSAQYLRRLALCKACDELRGGTCAQCGCYVEIRAAKRNMQCPHGISKW